MKTEEIIKKKQTDTSPIPPVRAPNGLPRAGPEPYKGAFRREKGWHPTSGAHPQAVDSKRGHSKDNKLIRAFKRDLHPCKLSHVQYDFPTF